MLESLISTWQSPETVVGTAPAGGAEVSQAVPAGQLWKIIAVSVSLAQGATQTPLPILRFTDGTNVFLEIPGTTTAQTASTTTQYTWSQDFSTVTGQIGSSTNVRACAPLPDNLVLRPAWTIATVTLGIGGNTAYGAPVFYVLKGVHN